MCEETPSNSTTSDPQRAHQPTAHARLKTRTKSQAMREVKFVGFSTITEKNTKQQVVTEDSAEGSDSTCP